MSTMWVSAEGREDAGQRADGAVGCGDDEELAVRALHVAAHA